MCLHVLVLKIHFYLVAGFKIHFMNPAYAFTKLVIRPVFLKLTIKMLQLSINNDQKPLYVQVSGFF